VWSHQWLSDPTNIIGEVVDVKSTDDGLRVRAQLDYEHNPRAAQVRQLMQRRLVQAFSFAYDVLDGSKSDDGVNELRELELYEVGPTLVGANPLTELIDAKATHVDDEHVHVTHGHGVAMRLRLAGVDVLDVEAKGAVSPHRASVSEGSWDSSVHERRVLTGQPASYYRKVYAWQDPEGDSSTKAGWRFIHHEVAGDGTPGPANLRALSSAIGVLNGARGGTTIPASDRAAVYSHLQSHFPSDREAPKLQ
jgi:HK97 family phage prohead protease